MLLLQFININRPPTKISWGTISLGHDKSNDVVIDEPGVSDFHAEITIDGNAIMLSDLLSENGTFVNNQRITRSKALQPWDRIKLASIEIEISEAEKYRPGDWALKKESDLLSSQYLPLQPITNVGRNPECDLVVLDGLLSRKHARLTIEGDRLLVEDLDSANGTFINGVRVKKSYATPGDEIAFDKISFELLGPCSVSSSADKEESTVIRDEHNEDTTLLNDPDQTVFSTDIDSQKDKTLDSPIPFASHSPPESISDADKTALLQPDNPQAEEQTALLTTPSQPPNLNDVDRTVPLVAASPSSENSHDTVKKTSHWALNVAVFLATVLIALLLYLVLR